MVNTITKKISISVGENYFETEVQAVLMPNGKSFVQVKEQDRAERQVLYRALQESLESLNNEPKDHKYFDINSVNSFFDYLEIAPRDRGDLESSVWFNSVDEIYYLNKLGLNRYIEYLRNSYPNEFLNESV